MRRSSVKFKITLWYILIMLAVSLTVFFIMNSFSVKSIENNMTLRVTRSVENLMKRVIDTRGNLRHLRPHEMFLDGVHMAVYDEKGQLLCGQNPFGISEEFNFQENKVRTATYNEKEYYEFDKAFSFEGGHKIWVKGIMSVSDEGIAAREVAKYNLVFIAIMIVIAAAGGYFITTRTLSPVNKISETAKSIIKSKDLKQRIKIGKGNDEFHDLANTFDEMLDEIEAVVEREKQFTSDASHELRTPVAVILSECEYMENYASSAQEMKESALSVKRQSEKMSKLISELLSISRMDRNTIALSFEETDLSELLTFICSEQEQINKSDITLECDIAPEVYAEADKIMIARLFINLISNAYQYNREKGSIKVSLREKGEKVIFSVSDTGIGISAENIPKIWERFYQVDEARTSGESDSMGLGLSMVKWIAEKHGGAVTVNSNPGEGSEFIFEFPKRR